MPEASASEADFLIVNGDIVTMDPQRRILMGGAVAVAGERILDVGSTTELKAKYKQTRVIDARGGVVTPGMINGHQHITTQVLIRCCMPDEWIGWRGINEWSIPMTANVTADDEELSATITAAQSALNGVTMMIEAGTLTWPERLVAGVEKVGVRATTGMWASSMLGRPYCTPNTSEVLDHHRKMLEAFPPGGLVSGWVTLIGHDTASDDLLVGAADLARAYGVGMTMHMSPWHNDTDSYLAKFNRRPIEHLHDLGVLGRHLLLAHGVWFEQSEVDLVLESGTAVAYCPWSYLRSGTGVSHKSKHAEMFLRGGRVCLGCDATNGGDTVDILHQANLAVGLAKDIAMDPSYFSSYEGFEMATIRGAEAIGMDHLIGSLERGKMADIVIHDTDSPNYVTKGNTILHLIWGTDGRSVRDTFVGGKQIVRDGQCITVDLISLKETAAAQAAAILSKTGLTVPSRWPVIPAG
jgi:5-methylthioadenosine/S-adenosylhomocysteine deaminase